MKDDNITEQKAIPFPKKPKYIHGIWVGSFIMLVGLVLSFVGVSIYCHTNEYNKVLNNPPDTNWVEEDLEPIFMTTGVCVLNTDDERPNIYYTVSANGFYYKVHYTVSQIHLFSFAWKYQNYIQINEVLL